MTVLDSNLSQALQLIATELAFLSPESPEALVVISGALATLAQSPMLLSHQEALSQLRHEREWIDRVQSGQVQMLEADVQRLQVTYSRLEEALYAPIAPESMIAQAASPPQPIPMEADQLKEPTIIIQDSDDLELMNEFCNEGRDLLEQIESGVLVLETQPQHKDMLNQVFRAFHTFKGGAGFLGLTPVNHLAHELESLLDAARNGRIDITPRVIDLILTGGDAMRQFVDLISQRLAQADKSQAIQVPVLALTTRVKAFLAGEDEPAPKKMDQLVAPEPTVEAQREIKSIPTPKAAVAPLKKSSDASHPEGLVNFVKLDTQKLDQLVDLVGELVIAQSMVVQHPHVKELESGGLAPHLRLLARITSDLQHNAMSLRMVPIRGAFQKMSRLVRDLSATQHKKVHLQLLGEDTEIDRNMVEELADPLMHMIRNAVDHGIESPDLRTEQGKPAQGTVKLQASHQGGGIVIRISDDGKGMDPEHIRRKAIEKRLISGDDLLSTVEIFDLIFQPGFSTAETITDISGRGVGMDVVRGNISRLRGRIEVASTLGQGSEFTIRLPLTLAIIDGMLVGVGDERFILPTLSIRESFRPSPGMVHSVQGRGEVVKVRDKLIPLVRLSQQLEIHSSVKDPTDGIVVVVDSRSQWRGLLVDRLIGKNEVVIKSLGETFKHAYGLSGSAILGDGRVALILDPDSLGNLQPTAYRSAA